MTETEPSEFRIVEVVLTADAASGSGPLFRADASEQVGSKEKFWCERVADGHKYLLKFARPKTGEDWAEKLSSEIAHEILGLPCAEIDLATYEGRSAVLSKFFPQDRERLIHGNELLLERDASYPSHKARRVKKHTLAAVFGALHDVGCPRDRARPPGIVDAPDLFCGYLVLDALIGNTDRHHENWGVLVAGTGDGGRTLTLAPTYDHGSSLGRELLDSARERKLQGVDPRATLISYAQAARSAFYLNVDDDEPLSLRDMIVAARDQRPLAMAAWSARLATSDTLRKLRNLVDRVPSTRISSIAREFAFRLLEHNCGTLLELVGPNA